MDSDASASQSTRGKTQKELRSGKKFTLLVDAPTLEPPERKKRAWESWSFEEKNCFFDAIKVHRRDFEMIKTFMRGKLGKSGTQRNKDQIRHMYYRTLGTIQKNLTNYVYPDVLADKADQEFYAMTAYAELRKKLKKDPSKKLMESKLEELLKTQQTVVKSKGKSAKVKIPIPSQRSEKSTMEKLIVEPTLELRLSPEDCYSQRSVQSIGGCPRLAVNIPIRTTISEVKSMLCEKWMTSSDRLILSFASIDKKQTPRIKNITTEDPKSALQTVYFTYVDTPFDPGIENRDDTRIIQLELMSKGLHLTYRFVKDRPFFEPISLVAKCASMFAEAITNDALNVPVMDHDHSDDIIRSMIFSTPKSLPQNGSNRKRYSSTSSRGKKKSLAVSADAVEQHLQLLNGLNKTTKPSRSPAYNAEVPEVPSSIRGIQEDPPPSFDQNSNSSITNILHSVLNDDSGDQRSEVHSIEIDNQVGLMMSENSVSFARATNFYDILDNDIPS